MGSPLPHVRIGRNVFETRARFVFLCIACVDYVAAKTDGAATFRQRIA